MSMHRSILVVALKQNSEHKGDKMGRFADKRTEAVYQTGFVNGVPKQVAHDAQWKISLLVAAFGLEDVRFIGRIARWAKEASRYGLHVDGKWYVTFNWNQGFGAEEIKLERR